MQARLVARQGPKQQQEQQTQHLAMQRHPQLHHCQAAKRVVARMVQGLLVQHKQPQQPRCRTMQAADDRTGCSVQTAASGELYQTCFGHRYRRLMTRSGSAR